MTEPVQTEITPTIARDLRWRWVVVGMLFLSTFLNYLDRQTLSVLMPTIKGEFGIDDQGYSLLVNAFLVPYIIAYVLGGRLVDAIGHRVALGWFVGIWSVAGICTGLAQTLGQLTICRAVLGAAEPGNYPAALQGATTWFPARMRGLATGIYQAGSATAAVIAAPLVAAITLWWGWRMAFLIPGVLGLVWVLVWWTTSRAPSAAYAAQIDVAAPTPPVAWSKLWRDRCLWGVLLARLITDQVWYFCLFWMPGYLQEHQHLSLTQAALVVWLPFLCGDLGGLAAGAVSDRLVAGGRSPWQARRLVLSVSAIGTAAVLLIPAIPGAVVAVAAFCVVALVCQVWLFTTTTLIADVFPRENVGSVLGIAGACGAIGGLISNTLIGASVGTLGYTPVFVILACLHPVAAVILRLLVRRD